MVKVRLGRTGIEVNRNGFGALPIQREKDKENAGRILRKAYDNGITFFDTARAYSDSEEKIGLGLSDVRDKIFIATKTMATTVEGFWDQLHTSLKLMKTDYIDIYQFHNPSFCPKPGDESGLYDAMLEAKAQGKIRFIGITNHRIHVAMEALESGLYDTIQYPFSYLAAEGEIELVKKCKEKDIGFICMKALAGGLVTRAEAAYAFLAEYDNTLPIWGIEREDQLDEFISFGENPPEMTEELAAYIEKEQTELIGEFCRACGYCMPCPQGIEINSCARMSLLLRRAPMANFLNENGQAMMAQIEKCTNCGACKKKCPYNLDTPSLLRKNLEDYKTFLN